jgi:hypothetical protein
MDNPQHWFMVTQYFMVKNISNIISELLNDRNQALHNFVRRFFFSRFEISVAAIGHSLLAIAIYETMICKCFRKQVKKL